MSFITSVISFCDEKNPGKGEDSILVELDDNAGIIASLDGCGGSGSRKYSAAENWTGAKIASAELSIALGEWFERNAYGAKGFKSLSTSELLAEIKKVIDDRLRALMDTVGDSGIKLGGKMVKSFPTTLSAAILDVKAENRIGVNFVWAGDSRGYIFSKTGLKQITVDDVMGGGDAYESLTNDDVMSNVISAEAEYHLNVKTVEVDEPCMAITASDGCCSNLISPAELEYILLETLMQSESPDKWKEALRSCFMEVSADDVSFVCAIIGFKNFKAVKQAYRGRYEDFQKRFGERLDAFRRGCSQDELYSLWLEYKPEYEGY